jgi:hypothetical protein
VVTVIAAIVLPILGVQMIGAGRDYRRGVGSQLSGESREPPNRRLVRIIWGVTALVAVVAGTLYAIVRVQLTLSALNGHRRRNQTRDHGDERTARTDEFTTSNRPVPG